MKIPACTVDDKNILICIHGYNVSEEGSRASYSEVFKRLFFSGIKSTIYMVSWYGDPPAPLSSTDPLPTHYHQAVVNAFNISKKFAEFIAALKGNDSTINVSVMAHSLGNMVASLAIQDYQAPIDKYFAINAAVALEAYDNVEDYAITYNIFRTF